MEKAQIKQPLKDKQPGGQASGSGDVVLSEAQKDIAYVWGSSQGALFSQDPKGEVAQSSARKPEAIIRERRKTREAIMGNNPHVTFEQLGIAERAAYRARELMREGEPQSSSSTTWEGRLQEESEEKDLITF